MSENQLMDKLAASFDGFPMYMESAISTLTNEKQKAEDELAEIISSIKKLEKIEDYWAKKYSEALRSKGDTDYAYGKYEQAKMLLLVTIGEPNSRIKIEVDKKGGIMSDVRLEDVYSNSEAKSILKQAEKTFRGHNKRGRSEAEKRLASIESRLLSLKEKNYSRQKEFDNLSFQPIEVKGEIYYRWLVEDVLAVEYKQEYTALAKKFSDISEYKDCDKLAEMCDKLAELKETLNCLDGDIEEVKKEWRAKEGAWWVFFAGGILGIILALITKGGIGGAILYGIIGLVIGCIIGCIIDSVTEGEYEQKIKEKEEEKSALRSEYEKKKEEVRKNYQSL